MCSNFESFQATLSMLRIAEPFITWGYPNLKTIKQMIYKRGHAKIDGRRVPLYSNTLIEKYLGKNSCFSVIACFFIYERCSCSRFMWFNVLQLVQYL